MTALAAPSYRSLVVPALKTAGVSLLLFGLAHVLFITWAVDRTGDASLLLRLARMLFVPMGVGIPFALVAAFLGAAVWRNAAGTRLVGAPYGVALATGLLPPIALALLHGPYGDDMPSALTSATVFVMIVALPTLAGVAVAGLRAGAPLGLVAMPFAFPWTMFILGEGVEGWAIPFVASLLLIVGASGLLMRRMARG